MREVEIRPDYDADFNNDVAILWLAEAAPASAQRYELYRGGDEWGKDLNLGKLCTSERHAARFEKMALLS